MVVGVGQIKINDNLSPPEVRVGAELGNYCQTINAGPHFGCQFEWLWWDKLEI